MHVFCSLFSLGVLLYVHLEYIVGHRSKITQDLNPFHAIFYGYSTVPATNRWGDQGTPKKPRFENKVTPGVTRR